jgi:two-component system sensor histidine kinase QseC
MVVALNKLLERIGNTLESERCFTANAAHELRTPLAAIQAQLHAARAAESDEERRRSMDQLQRGVERGIRLVGQLLTLARLDPEQALTDVKPVNLGEVAQAVCAELAPLALQREQDLELDFEANLPLIQGNADLLSMLLGNLVDNAIRYTPQGGHIGVAVRRNVTGLLMEVSDDGPGIPEAQRERVLERFYRIAEQVQPGTGLGLAICRRIAEIHGAHIYFSNGPTGRGLTVSVLLVVADASVARQGQSHQLFGNKNSPQSGGPSIKRLA